MNSVNIVLATYKPNEVFFRKLLDSLNSQTYSNIKLIIRDDSADEFEFEKVREMINKHITAFDFEIIKNDKNIGSNKTFEELTRDVEEDYVAYCDQDDIWEKDKISRLVEAIETEEAVLVYSDLSLIDENDVLVARSLKDVHKRLEHRQGFNLFHYFLSRNSVTGCTLLMKASVAKKALPFCTDYYVHDHWLALYASSVGRISYVQEPLIRYRIHGGNQIGVSLLSGIENKSDYLSKKLFLEKEKLDYLLANYDFNSDCIEAINRTLRYTEERISFFKKRSIKNFGLMTKKIKNDHQLILLEIAINFLPRRLGNKLINKLKSYGDDMLSKKKRKYYSKMIKRVGV